MADTAGQAEEKLAAEQPARERLAEIAKHTLEHFEKTATAAQSALASGVRSPSTTSLAAINTLTADRAVRNLEGMADDQIRDLTVLCREPAIARVAVRDDEDREQTIFITRGAGGTGAGTLVASYRSPLGRLAAIPVGQDHECRTPGGIRIFEVMERAVLRPAKPAGEWDSVNTVAQGSTYGPLTIVSLRALLLSQSTEEDELDLLEKLLEQDRRSSNVIDGLRRTVIEKMALRDQPLLDEYQDEIFRLPLDTNLVILGPPGSGKTTTLIKRLGLKQDREHLEDNERILVERSVAGLSGLPTSWMMFTPTELLKQYVKESFARENIPASDLRIQTWSDYRRELARNKLNVLRTSSGRGLVLKDNVRSLKPATMDQQIDWFSDYDRWQASQFWSELEIQAKRLSAEPVPTITTLGRRLLTILNSMTEARQTIALVSFNELSSEVSTLMTKLRNDVDDRLRRAFALELKQDRGLLDNLLSLLNTLGDSSDTTDESEDLDVDEEEEEGIAAPHRGAREEAFEAYKRATRAQARAIVSGRSVRRQSRNGRVLEWLGPRSLSESERLTVGQNLQVLAALRHFVNPVRRYIDRMPARYRRFRRERQVEGIWYVSDGFGTNELGPLELDAILLSTLRGARELLTDRRVLQRIDEPWFAALKVVQQLYRSQIIVDEATDFSPLQLGCMAALCDPATRSFLACGDFNQRVTEWGTRSIEELKWAVPNIDIRSIEITYRHSRQLNELAHRIVGLDGADGPKAQLPAHVDNEGVSPVIAKGVTGQAVIEWLAARIVEIERFTRKLPSIAILVNGESEVQPLAEMLNTALLNQNIRVVACPGGQVVGQDIDVRVFDIEHIKGLEFEAVFFVGIDELATRQPKLFEKYLYVGTTRAATYLGLTCTDELPSRISLLESAFVNSWL